MKNAHIRVRFAPSPTGLMHLGSIRTALMNYLLARQKGGTFILRIEDTDAARNFDPKAEKILSDLAWFSLTYDEGPVVSGPCDPYYQSERLPIYQEYLEKLKHKNIIYRCFCSAEDLEHKRQRQIAMKLPPRYDRTCAKLSEDTIDARLANESPFIWRLKLDHLQQISITDLAHGQITFDFKNFSDFPLTRQDGSFTFIFANFVDDVTMRISHVIRGEDHLTNTASQAALYDALGAAQPIFWHMPILCSKDGKKMSKRDFGFSVDDLMGGGYLPEAILNYLAIIGGGNFEQEIMSVEELTNAFNFDHMSATGRVTYDLEKLNWVNHKWIDKLDPQELLVRCRPIIQHNFPSAVQIPDEALSRILQILKPGMTTLNDCTKELAFYFNEPIIEQTQLAGIEQLELIRTLVANNLAHIKESVHFVNTIKNAAQTSGIAIKNLFQFMRLALMGSVKGPAIHELIDVLGHKKAQKRLERLLS